MNRRDLILAGPVSPLVVRGDIIFRADHNSTILTLTANGQIRVGPGVKPDEAAQRFLEILSELYPQWICKPK
jgi:hypothetical protein